MAKEDGRKSETSQKLTDFGRGAGERAVLGKSPVGSMLRIALFLVLFVVIGGALFVFLQR